MRTQRERTIAHLQQELDRLQLAVCNIQLIILNLKECDDTTEEDASTSRVEKKDIPPKPLPKIPFVQDRYGTTIKLGDRVVFLTK